MGRKISLDVDNLINKLQDVAVDLPGMLAGAAASAGMELPPMVSQVSPWIGVAAQLFGKFVRVSGDEDDHGLGKGLPNTGELGRGKRAYIRKKKYFNDEDVCKSFVYMTNGMRTSSPKMADQILNTVNYTLGLMYPGTADHNAKQTREAIDRLFEEDVFSTETNDKLGDLLNYCLTTPRIIKDVRGEKDKEEEDAG